MRAKVREDTQKRMLKYYDKINMQAASKLNETTLERRILGILMLYPELYGDVEGLNSELFVTDFNKQLFERLKPQLESGEIEL